MRLYIGQLPVPGGSRQNILHVSQIKGDRIYKKGINFRFIFIIINHNIYGTNELGGKTIVLEKSISELC